MKEYYNNNPNFKRYVDRHCKQYGYTVDEALTHEIVRQVYLYYKENERDAI